MAKWGKAVCLWYLPDIYAGDPVRICDEAIAAGMNIIMPKFGNGQKAWVGLEPLIAEAHRRGLEVWGWWYFFGYASEGRICGQTARRLGLDGVIEDVEGHFERSEVNKNLLPAKAERMQDELRQEFDGPIGLCSWWKPSVHGATPIRELLAACDFNMPQMYWMGRRAVVGSYSADSLVSECIDEYARLFNWPAEKTVAVMAAFGEKVYNAAKKDWELWQTTVAQMDAANARAKSFGCAGASWWSWNYILGKSGNVHRQPQPEYWNAISRYDWPGPADAGPQPPPPPPDDEHDHADQAAELRTIAGDLHTAEARLGAVAARLETGE